ncbi:MAG: siderophore-interacting protein [Leadbetterella sp.]|nr:siderophore-interacting protein [Leadbetterella sp.]
MKTKIIRNILQLKRKEYITPHLIRVTLGGDAVAEYKDCTLGNNNKIFIPPAGVQQVHFPEYNEELEIWLHPEPNLVPAVRTYTHRAIDLEKKEMVIDFVHHGENGPASRWAIQAEPGDELGVAMKAVTKELFPRVGHYLLAGDATAIPVLSCILESLPAQATGVCVIEVHGPEDELQIRTAADIRFIWLHNPQPEAGSELAATIKGLELPEKSRFAYIAAEYRTVKELREYLRHNGWVKEEFYAFSYWKAGVAEDQSAQDRRAEREAL